MCCTFTESKMSNTRIYVGEAEMVWGTAHVLAYQNVAITNGPNAMVIPFPTNESMDQFNVIDTRKFKNFLKDITDATKRHIKSFDGGRRLGSRGFVSLTAAAVFDVGSYTVVLADHVDQIQEALTRVPTNKRPTVSNQFLEGYGKLYPNQPIAVCCWDGEIEAEPLMWYYKPRDPSTLFIPTMDAHDGLAPRVGERVDTDHIISVGTSNMVTGESVYYTQKIPAEVKDLLPTRVYGKRLPERLENGDCFVKTATLHTTQKDFWDGVPAVEIKRGDFTTVMNGWY